MEDIEFKKLLDVFADFGICEMSDNISDEIDRTYSFKPFYDWLEVGSKQISVFPLNWTVEYMEDVTEEGEARIVISRYFPEALNKQERMLIGRVFLL